MKRTIYALVSALALLGTAPAARADNKLLKCMEEAIADCDGRFPPSDYRLIAIRGWCYMIGTAICKAS
ncbi:MAG TPA: hypothetical protein VMT21_05435 [Gemmatimonadales bacterium]|nr:hypothetical protein [Gemmatimonadales bacterium]